MPKITINYLIVIHYNRCWLQCVASFSGVNIHLIINRTHHPILKLFPSLVHRCVKLHFSTSYFCIYFVCKLRMLFLRLITKALVWCYYCMQANVMLPHILIFLFLKLDHWFLIFIHLDLITLHLLIIDKKFLSKNSGTYSCPKVSMKQFIQ